MSLLFQHGSGKNVYDPYMGHTNGKKLPPLSAIFQLYHGDQF